MVSATTFPFITISILSTGRCQYTRASPSAVKGQHPELEDLDEIDFPERQIHQQRRVFLASVEMRVSDRRADASPLIEQHVGKRVGLG